MKCKKCFLCLLLLLVSVLVLSWHQVFLIASAKESVSGSDPDQSDFDQSDSEQSDPDQSDSDQLDPDQEMFSLYELLTIYVGSLIMGFGLCTVLNIAGISIGLFKAIFSSNFLND